MDNSRTIESNLYDSFSKVRSDILTISTQLNKLRDEISGLKDEISKLKDEDLHFIEKFASQKEKEEKKDEKVKAVIDTLNLATKRLMGVENKVEILRQRKPVTIVKSARPATKVVKTVIYKHGKHKFVASKSGKKFHTPNCVFAKNIKPKMKKVFKTKNAALNQGFKACHCVLNL